MLLSGRRWYGERLAFSGADTDRSDAYLLRKPTQVFFKLRLPSSIPFLFTSLKVAIALSVVGAIVAELPTGGQGGLGARLLTGSYYGQITMIWAALIVASVVSALLVTAIGRAERIALRRLNGGQAVTA